MDNLFEIDTISRAEVAAALAELLESLSPERALIGGEITPIDKGLKAGCEFAQALVRDTIAKLGLTDEAQEGAK